MDISQNWEIVDKEFESFSLDIIKNETLQTLSFHISALRYLKERSLYFTKVNNMRLITKPDMDSSTKVVMDIEEDVISAKTS